MHNIQRPAETKSRKWKLAAISLGGIGLLAACGSTATSTGAAAPSPVPPASVSVHAASGPAASSTAIPCAQITSLRTSLTKLSHTTVNPASAGQLTAELRNIHKQLTALKSAGGGAYSAQADQLSSAFAQISKDAQKLAMNPSSANLTALTTAVQKLKTTAKPMVKEMQKVCPQS